MQEKPPTCSCRITASTFSSRINYPDSTKGSERLRITPVALSRYVLIAGWRKRSWMWGTASPALKDRAHSHAEYPER